jgi:hypothetical protein
MLQDHVFVEHGADERQLISWAEAAKKCRCHKPGSKRTVFIED